MRCDVRAAIAQIVIKEYPWGSRYEGEVNQDGEWHGKGVYSLPNGVRYVGEFRDNDFHGHGTHTDANGRVMSGKWEKNIFRR